MTHPSWQPDIVVDAELARALITEQLPELADRPVTPLGRGIDNAAFLVDGWVFRFPCRRIAVPWLEREVRLLPRLAGRLPVPAPNPQRSGAPSERFPFPFAGYRCLPGVTGCSVSLDGERGVAVAAALGGFLRALHDTPADLVEAARVGGDDLRRLDVPWRLDLTRQRAERLRRQGQVALAERVEALVAAAAAALPSDAAAASTAEGCLVHGDLYARHLLVDGERLSGVIDWGDAHRGDPALDLAFVLTLPPRARAAFQAAYGPVAPEVWGRARFRAVCHSVAVAGLGHEVGDEALWRVGVAALSRLAAG